MEILNFEDARGGIFFRRGGAAKPDGFDSSGGIVGKMIISCLRACGEECVGDAWER